MFTHLQDFQCHLSGHHLFYPPSICGFACLPLAEASSRLAKDGTDCPFFRSSCDLQASFPDRRSALVHAAYTVLGSYSTKRHFYSCSQEKPSDNCTVSSKIDQFRGGKAISCATWACRCCQLPAFSAVCHSCLCYHSSHRQLRGALVSGPVVPHYGEPHLYSASSCEPFAIESHDAGT